jgi:hypothetical protein
VGRELGDQEGDSHFAKYAAVLAAIFNVTVSCCAASCEKFQSPAQAMLGP